MHTSSIVAKAAGTDIATAPPPWALKPMLWTMARFALWGPLVGGLPYNLFVIGIPFSYLLGFVPALLAGLLWALWWHAPSRRRPTAPWRSAIAAACALVACAFAALIYTRGSSGLDFWFALLAAHGVPAAVVLALAQKQSRTGGRRAGASVGWSAA